MKVNFAAILDFFFQIYSSVKFIPNPLCYRKYVILLSTFLAIYLGYSDSKYMKTADVLDLKVK